MAEPLHVLAVVDATPERVVSIHQAPDRAIIFFIDGAQVLAIKEYGFYVRDRKVEEPAEDQAVRIAFMEWVRNRMSF